MLFMCVKIESQIFIIISFIYLNGISVKKISEDVKIHEP